MEGLWLYAIATSLYIILLEIRQSILSHNQRILEDKQKSALEYTLSIQALVEAQYTYTTSRLCNLENSKEKVKDSRRNLHLKRKRR